MAEANKDAKALNRPWGDGEQTVYGEQTVTREYRVKPVLRYIITEYEDAGDTGNVRTLGEYDSKDLAWVVAEGIAKANGGFAVFPSRDYRALAAKLHDEYGIVG